MGNKATVSPLVSCIFHEKQIGVGAPLAAPPEHGFSATSYSILLRVVAPAAAMI
jgi:hypothetical protein